MKKILLLIITIFCLGNSAQLQANLDFKSKKAFFTCSSIISGGIYEYFFMKFFDPKASFKKKVLMISLSMSFDGMYEYFFNKDMDSRPIFLMACSRTALREITGYFFKKYIEPSKKNEVA